MEVCENAIKANTTKIQQRKDGYNFVSIKKQLVDLGIVDPDEIYDVYLKKAKEQEE